MSSEFRPYTLIAELTYRCPLRCPYCSNPVDWARRRKELDTETWRRVFREAEDLGVVQLNLTGGEPLLRDDLTDIASRGGATVVVGTNGTLLTEPRIARLMDAGVTGVAVAAGGAR